jgi:transcriptional regulator with XRE-family HTH domain
MSFIETIQKLRKNTGLSQHDVANAIGMARATYASLEVGRREPDLAELRSLSQFYEVSIYDLIDHADIALSSEAESSMVYSSAEESDIIPRDTNPEIAPDKLREVLLYILGKVGAKPNVGETVLYKLLYFIDFDYYEKCGQSVTGLTYVRNHYGPTPTRSFVDVVKQMELNGELEIVSTDFFNNTQKKYLPIVKSSLNGLSAKELAHIDDEILRLADKTATELSTLSHHDMPWLTAKQGEPLQYRDVFYRTNLTSVTDSDDEL